jgi:hypothetical protein
MSIESMNKHIKGYKDEKFMNLLLNKSLYDPIAISIEDLGEMAYVLSNNSSSPYKIKCYCCYCTEISSFILERYNLCNSINNDLHIPSRNATNYQKLINHFYELIFNCVHDENHTIRFFVFVSNDKAMKVGQYPSVSDLNSLNKYKYKSLLKEQYIEYITAVQLYSNKAGIGSFVYLRRIIEKLVFDIYYRNSESLVISKDDYRKVHFDEKIKIIKDFLPKILVSNKNIYGILSKGIHELNEKECLEYFPVILNGIHLILDDVLSEKERIDNEKEFTKSIAYISNEIRNRKIINEENE